MLALVFVLWIRLAGSEFVECQTPAVHNSTAACRAKYAGSTCEDQRVRAGCIPGGCCGSQMGVAMLRQDMAVNCTVACGPDAELACDSESVHRMVSGCLDALQARLAGTSGCEVYRRYMGCFPAACCEYTYASAVRQARAKLGMENCSATCGNTVVSSGARVGATNAAMAAWWIISYAFDSRSTRA